ncbi:ATP-binding protein [uncultured Paenibacillus sp.]|uniref:sensor histidine kinase n=1 Tax=uncultured Paenibacillus sp. TaxID=227322 RepID=UPI0028D00243|nr:ATP-binding protein [uncultured Paenibacillus sp.]
MPIRLRLTLWSCLIFGVVLMAITSSIYLVHRTSLYNETDRSLESVALHVREEVQKEIKQGKPLSEIRLPSEEYSANGVSVWMKDAAGKSIAKSANPFRAPEVSLPETHALKRELHTFTDPSLGRYRMLVAPVLDQGNAVGYIQAEISLKQIDSSLKRLAWPVLTGTLAGLFLAALGSWFLARKALSGVEIISQTAKAIAVSQGFDRRVLYTGAKDELSHLADTFNEMLESLEKAFVSQRRFIADASHELRAPLTTIRGNLDILQRVKHIPPQDQAEILADTRKEAARMSKLVADLLSLARADAGQEIRMRIVDLSKLLQEVELDMKAWNLQATIRCEYGASALTWGNEDLLKQLLLIFAENAVRYTPEEGLIALSVDADKERCVMRVADTGIGIEPQDLPHIFERFYRSESARMHASDGTGLGLSIAKWIVEFHGGNIIVTSTPGQGSEFQVRLPKIKD